MPGGLSALLLENLPDVCVLDILKQCGGRDVLSFQSTCKRFLSIGRLPLLWNAIILREMGLRVPDEFCDDYRAQIKIYRSVLSPRQSDMKKLDYWGVLTDGGLGDEEPAYWVDNMFQYGLHHLYCSEMYRSHDVRCVGVLPCTVPSALAPLPAITRLPQEPESGQPGPSSRVGREVMFDDNMTRHLCASSGVLPQGQRTSIVLTRRIQIGRMGRLTCPVGCGVVLAGTVDWGEGERSSAGLAQFLYDKCRGGALDELSGLLSMEAVLKACAGGRVGAPEAVRWGDGGEWVEFERRHEEGQLHPAVWFKFYSKEEYGKRNADWGEMRRSLLSCEFKALGAQCGHADEKVGGARGTQSEPNAIEENEAAGSDTHNPYEGVDGDVGIVVEVSEDESWGSDSDLEGLMDDLHWEAFHGINNETQFYITRKSMAGRKFLDIPLAKPVLGNVVCVMLNSCENLMEELHDMHEAPNVDVNFVWMIGQEIKLGDQ